MQPLIDKAQAALGGNLGLTLGCLIIAALAVQVLVMLASTLRRVVGEGTQRTLERERLELLVKSARSEWQDKQAAKDLWNGYRKFTVSKKIKECDGVYSFHLAPHDGKPLPPFKPGQYLTFSLDVPGRDKPVVRCYSLSDGPIHTTHYRVTIKKEGPPADKPDLPPGVASSYFCDAVKEGDILNVKAPTGHFYLDMAKPNPIVLLGGGIGVTPMLSMAKAVAASGSKREVWFFYGVRSTQEHMLKEEIQTLAEAHDNIRLHVCYSRPGKGDVKGRDYHHASRVTPELLKELLPSNNYEYYLCGAGPFMQTLNEGLESWGVPEKEIHYEAFGPATVKKKAPPRTASETAFLSKFTVTFSKSGKTCGWDPSAENVLKFAQAQGVHIDSGCCTGGCGSCVVAVKGGKFKHTKDPDNPPEAGSCLTCIAQPAGDLVLDA
ncbi:MAG: 2Fe-2S iron-sulfur cluster binding domain-containing protein [Verrucomicrobia bacterium]|nr:2Fe-2S iron-sulfur cluster binding domain-containing protein [Verrucomicrobiota bacterium]